MSLHLRNLELRKRRNLSWTATQLTAGNESIKSAIAARFCPTTTLVSIRREEQDQSFLLR